MSGVSLEPGRPVAATLRASCRWVPGTHDRVRLTLTSATPGREPAALELALRAFRLLVGREGVDSLYLFGRHEISLSSRLWAALGGPKPAQPANPTPAAHPFRRLAMRTRSPQPAHPPLAGFLHPASRPDPLERAEADWERRLESFYQHRREGGRPRRWRRPCPRLDSFE